MTEGDNEERVIRKRTAEGAGGGWATGGGQRGMSKGKWMMVMGESRTVSEAGLPHEPAPTPVDHGAGPAAGDGPPGSLGQRGARRDRDTRGEGQHDPDDDRALVHRRSSPPCMDAPSVRACTWQRQAMIRLGVAIWFNMKCGSLLARPIR